MTTSQSTWRAVLRTNFTDWSLLADFLELSAEQRRSLVQVRRFPLWLPRRLADKIVKGTLDDPILRQFVPTVAELDVTEGFGCDPVGDQESRLAPKLLKKYSGRALLVTTGACAMHCRFCFRQHFDYPVDQPSFEAELELLRSDPSIHEVILSGGDPLSLSDATLGALIREIDAIPHVRRLRFHSRFPIGVPERIDAGFYRLLDNLRMTVWFVVHTNHPKELDADVVAALRSLRERGIVVVNQAVLLRGVNDSEETLVELCETLVDHGIFPYYLHQLDRTSGTAHFEVEEGVGKALIHSLTQRLPGYAVPKYVREIPTELSKTSIG